MNMIIKIWNGNSRKPITKYYSDHTRRFSSTVVPNSIKKAYLKVSYGNKKCNLGCICEFYNDSEVFSKSELIKTLRDFIKEGK